MAAGMAVAVRVRRERRKAETMECVVSAARR
jgi:hypothetical protein